MVELPAVAPSPPHSHVKCCLLFANTSACVYMCVAAAADSLKDLILVLSLASRDHVTMCHRYRKNLPLSSKS